MKARILLSLLIAPIALCCGAAEPKDTLLVSDAAWEAFIQQWSDEVEDETLDQSMLSLLTDWHEHPFDLNTVSRNELQQLPFLTQEAIDNILLYARQNAFYSLGELALIPHLSPTQQRWLCLFARVEVPQQSVRNDSSVKTEVLTRFDVPLYDRVGWDWKRGIAHRLKYTGSYGNHWEWGLHADKDAGEPMFTRERPLWDSHGGFVALKDVGGKKVALQTLLVGDYKAGFGEGLVVNNGLRFGKSVTSGWRTTNGITPHRSTDEYHFMRGIATTVAFGAAWRLSAFYSWRQFDAVVSDSNTIATIVTDGLHRTASEQAKRHTVNSHVVGAHLGWNADAWHAGATGMYQYIDHVFRQPAALYRQIYPEGYQFGAASVDYGYGAFPFYFQGETARSFDMRGGGWATLNKLTWRFNSNTQLSAIQRYYSKDYYSPLASAYGEESTVRNESGAALLLDADHIGNFAIKAYADFFYSPWPRYTMTRSSWGWEGMAQGTWKPSRHWAAQLRYQCKSKESNDVRHYSHRVRASVKYDLSKLWSLQLTGAYHYYVQPTVLQSHGYVVMPRVDFCSRQGVWRWTLAAGCFGTDDYNSRLYLYEPTLFQSYGMQAYYGKGERAVTTLRYKTRNRHWDLQCRAALTHYRDRETISSGVLQINSNVKADVQLLVRFHF